MTRAYGVPGGGGPRPDRQDAFAACRAGATQLVGDPCCLARPDGTAGGNRGGTSRPRSGRRPRATLGGHRAGGHAARCERGGGVSPPTTTTAHHVHDDDRRRRRRRSAAARRGRHATSRRSLSHVGQVATTTTAVPALDHHDDRSDGGARRPRRRRQCPRALAGRPHPDAGLPRSPAPARRTGSGSPGPDPWRSRWCGPATTYLTMAGELARTAARTWAARRPWRPRSRTPAGAAWPR